MKNTEKILEIAYEVVRGDRIVPRQYIQQIGSEIAKMQWTLPYKFLILATLYPPWRNVILEEMDRSLVASNVASELFLSKMFNFFTIQYERGKVDDPLEQTKKLLANLPTKADAQLAYQSATQYGMQISKTDAQFYRRLSDDAINLLLYDSRTQGALFNIGIPYIVQAIAMSGDPEWATTLIEASLTGQVDQFMSDLSNADALRDAVIRAEPIETDILAAWFFSNSVQGLRMLQVLDVNTESGRNFLDSIRILSDLKGINFLELVNQLDDTRKNQILFLN